MDSVVNGKKLKDALSRTKGELAAVKQDVMKNVPEPVQERMGERAKIGLGLILIGVTFAAYVLHLAMTLKDPNWKTLAIMLLLPILLFVFGGNMISEKLTRRTLLSLGAVVRGFRGGNGGGNGGGVSGGDLPA